MINLDVALLIFVGIGALLGLKNGLLKEVVGTIGLLFAAIIANVLAPLTSPWFGLVHSESIRVVVVWFIVFVVVMIALKLIAKLLSSLMDAIDLDWINRLAGGAFGAIKFCLLAAVLITLVEVLCSNMEGLPILSYIKDSKYVPMLHRMADVLMPWLSENILKPALEILHQ